MPCPEVAGPNQLPDSAKSAFVGRALPASQVTFCVRRLSFIEPVRPEPSVNAYDSEPVVQLSKASVAVPTAAPVVIGGAAKLPPVLR